MVREAQKQDNRIIRHVRRKMASLYTAAKRSCVYISIYTCTFVSNDAIEEICNNN